MAEEKRLVAEVAVVAEEKKLLEEKRLVEDINCRICTCTEEEMRVGEQYRAATMVDVETLNGRIWVCEKVFN
ncbi:hypothetical protein A2U01_0072124 [Trifolium medium]|uniref:Uncharacterized protein n=1 Tax=Trifolium medium TaxID=97028 RepID=A0A392SSH7_9FABA|nr:hypothetical protein [Trifolium medium]